MAYYQSPQYGNQNSYGNPQYSDPPYGNPQYVNGGYGGPQYNNPPYQGQYQPGSSQRMNPQYPPPHSPRR